MKIVCIGDSLTYGYGVPQSLSWVTLLKLSTDYQIINKGINGDTTVGILSRFNNHCIDLYPDLVVIMAGTNDLLIGRSIETVVDNITYMIDECIKNNIKPIVMIPPYTLPSLAEERWFSSIDYNYINDMISSMEAKLLQNIKTADLIALFRTIPLDEIYYLDGIHLSTLGNEIIFNNVNSLINQIKKQ